MIDIFKKRAAPGRANAIKGWVTEQLGLTEADLVTVAELACHEPDCPPVETVVAVHRGDGSRDDWRVHKPIAEIDHADIQEMLS